MTGGKWRFTTVRNIFLAPRICGQVVYRGEILHDADGNIVRGEWEPILTDDGSRTASLEVSRLELSVRIISH